jgi:hypothetical protein
LDGNPRCSPDGVGADFYKPVDLIMLRESALDYLLTREAKPGETVQVGWFVFRIIHLDGQLDLETLDFKALASFTRDFTVAEHLYRAQGETLRQLGEQPNERTLMQPALVSHSYTPLSTKAFIERHAPTNSNDSGWYVGLMNETLDTENAASFVHQSLYELSINDQRFARFWLLPAGYRVYFDCEEPRIEKLETTPDAII